MSYYSFFKGWLLLSQPPGCLRLPTSFATERIVRDLSWRSGLFPFPRRMLALAVCLPGLHLLVFGVCIGLVSPCGPPSRNSALPPAVNSRGATSIAFGENQLSPGLISLSLRSTAHPLIFQHQWVRSSIPFYRNFNLAMGSSPGFGSAPRNSYSPCSDSVSLRLRLIRLNLAA